MLKDFLILLISIAIILNIIFAIVIIFYERKNTSSTFAWIMVLVFIPYFGFIFYLIFGLDTRKHKVFFNKAKKDQKIYDEFLQIHVDDDKRINKNENTSSIKKNFLNIPKYKHLNSLVYLNYTAGISALTDNNIIEIFNEGNSKFKSLFEAIDNSKEYIHIEYYIIRNDNIGKELIQLLTKAALRGVEVKLIIDGMGCYFTSKKLFKALIDVGGKVGIFLPPLLVRINYRDHRKISVIDGKIGFLGGLNIGDEYLGRVKRFGFWRDSHIKVIGEAVKHIELRFLMDWSFCTNENISLNSNYFKESHKIENGVKMQIVSSGPDTQWENIHNTYFKMICEAEKSIYIITPYFIPDESILNALRVQALSGLDIRIIFPAKPDHLFVYWASLSYLGQLLKAGVRCYQYKKGFIHSKVMTIDSLVTTVGTTNMDIRSFKLNFEINAVIYDKKQTAIYNVDFFNDIEDSEEITLDIYNKRKTSVKIKESVSRLLSPLL